MPSTNVQYDFARFLHVRRAYGPSFSPDGKRIAFISDLTGHSEAYAVPVEGGWPERLTFADDRVGMVAFSPVDDRMIAATDSGGDERVQLWLLSAHGEEMRPLTHQPDAIHNFGGWSPDGRRIAYSGNERDPRCFDVYMQDVETGEARRLWETDGNYQVSAWSPDGRHLVVSQVESSSNNDLYELDVTTGASRHLTPHQGQARFLCPCYDADGRGLLLLTDRDSDVLVIARLNVASLSMETVVDRGWDVEEISLSPDRATLAYRVNVDGYSELCFLHLGSGRTRAVALPRGVIARGFVGNLHDTLCWSTDGARLAFSLTTARETQNVWLADVSLEGKEAATRLTAATQAGIPPEALAEPELIHYPTFDGREIPAFLYRPADATPQGDRSAIVLVHGGPAGQTHPDFSAATQYFVHRGYIVLAPNVRGSTGYGKVYILLDEVEKRMDSVADAKAAADWLSRSGWVHPRRIAVMGQSYGGFMVLASLCTYPETWAAGIDFYGIVNFISFLERTHPFRRQHREAEYGSLAHDRDLLRRISPLTHIDKIVAPLLVVHGEKDLRVPIEESEQVVSELQSKGVPVEFIRLPNEGHGIASLSDQMIVYPAVADFLGRYLSKADSDS